MKAVWSPIYEQIEFPHVLSLRNADSEGRNGSALPCLPYLGSLCGAR